MKVGNTAIRDKEAKIDALTKEVRHLKQIIRELGLEEDKAQGRVDFSGRTNYDDQVNWPRPRLVSELKGLDGIIERFTKANEQLMHENKTQTIEIRGLHDLLDKESKKVENYKHKVIRETGNVMVVEEEINIAAMNDLGVKHAIG
jgi:16S rRNA G527 N7-methylase RsmG